MKGGKREERHGEALSAIGLGARKKREGGGA